MTGQLKEEAKSLRKSITQDMPVSTHTLNKLCAILDCRLEDIAEYIPDE